jgi:transketolase
MSTAKPLMRDAFINEIYEQACKDPKIYFLSADLGAQALDTFRQDLSKQFIHCGISEQNMIDVAAGLALAGETVFVYAMAPFVTFRCFEQIKVALATMKAPVCIIGVGVGFSYDDAGPTHYATEDISCMRSLAGIEILSPTDTQSTVMAAREACINPKLRYIRLDRKHLPDIYPLNDNTFYNRGFAEIKKGKDLCIVSLGLMTHRALEVANELKSKDLDVGVVDIFRVKPFNSSELFALLKQYSAVVTLEEHFLSGGLGSIIAEEACDLRFQKPILRLGVKDHYYFENGGRERVLTLAGLDNASITERIKNFAKEII